MKAFVSLAALVLACAPAVLESAETRGQPPASKPSEAPKRHPLKGVIASVDVERSSLMVKHEAIPGVMRAMTMFFRVDDTTLKSVQKGQTITAMMSRQADEWWLQDVKVVASASTK